MFYKKTTKRLVSTEEMEPYGMVIDLSQRMLSSCKTCHNIRMSISQVGLFFELTSGSNLLVV